MIDQSKNSHLPEFRVCTVRQWAREGESNWAQIGVAFKRPDNQPGYVVQFDAHPVGNSIVLLPLDEEGPAA